MASLISVYKINGTFLSQFIGHISMQQRHQDMDKGTLTFENSNIKMSKDLLLPGNIVLVEDQHLNKPWISIITAPTSTNITQSVVALLDAKSLLIGTPILESGGLGQNTTVSRRIEFIIEQSHDRGERNIIYSSSENTFTFEDSILEDDGAIHLGKDIYTYLNELADNHHFEWWLEPHFSVEGLLGTQLRIADLRQVDGNLIAIPTHGTVQGIGLAYTNKYYTAIAVIKTSGERPEVTKIIKFKSLIENFGLFTKVITQQALEKYETGTAVQQLLVNMRPRRTVQLHLDTRFTHVISTVEVGSVHTVILGNVGFTGKRRGTILDMRVIALAYNSGEGVIGVVLEEFFGELDSVEISNPE